MHYTVSIGHKENVEKLLKHGMRVQHQSSADGATPLHRAAQIGSIEIAMVLLNHGADINSTNYLGQTPLHVALEKEFTDFAKFLISKGARKKCKHNCMRCKIFNDSINKNSKQYNESKPRRNRRNKQNRREAIESPFYIDHDQLQDHLVVESETPNKSCKHKYWLYYDWNSNTFI